MSGPHWVRPHIGMLVQSRRIQESRNVGMYRRSSSRSVTGAIRPSSVINRVVVLVLTPGICHWFTDRKVKVEVQYYQNITLVPLKSVCQLSVSSHDLYTQNEQIRDF